MATNLVTCKVITTAGTLWGFCPSLNAAIAFTVLFSVAFIAQIVQGIYYRKVYTWVIAMSAIWQVLAYVLRVLSIQNPANLGDYAGWFVLILVAPLWTNAFVYMVLGRMVWNFVPNAKIWRISAWRFGQLFIGLDIIAFIIQVYGAASAEQDNNTSEQTLQGIHIYMAGVSVQQLFILIFCCFSHRFWTLIRIEQKAGGPQLSAKDIKSALILLYTIWLVLALITLRICFRVAEYSRGLQSIIPNHEAYQYCFDSLPMLLAFVVISIYHPGRLMTGAASGIPSRKERNKYGLNKAQYLVSKAGAAFVETQIDLDNDTREIQGNAV